MDLKKLKNFLLLLKKYWLKFAHILAYVNTRIILTVLYFLVFPFFAIPYQLIKKIKSRNKTSNWKDYDREVDLREQF